MCAISPAETNRILSAHRLYLETDRKQGARADLSGIDLSGRSFSDMNLRRTRFAHALLVGTDFSRSNVTRANPIVILKGSKLGSGASFVQL